MTGPLAAFTVGEGQRPAVLLHGFLGSGKNLRALAQRWATRAPDRRFLLPDLRGHGESPPLRRDDGLDAVARDVLETAAAAGLAPPFPIVGHSLGGRVALAAARVAPEQLSDVVLLDIGPGPVDPAVSESRRVLDVLRDAPADAPDRRTVRDYLLGRGLTPALADWLLMNLRADGGRFTWRIDVAALDRLHERFNRDDLWPVVASRPARIRAVRGERSTYLTAADAERLRDAGCAVATLTNAGHFVHVDALDALVDVLVRWLP